MSKKIFFKKVLTLRKACAIIQSVNRTEGQQIHFTSHRLTAQKNLKIGVDKSNLLCYNPKRVRRTADSDSDRHKPIKRKSLNLEKNLLTNSKKCARIQTSSNERRTATAT